MRNQIYAKALVSIHKAGYKISQKNGAHLLQNDEEWLLLWGKPAVCLFASSLQETLRAPRRDA